MNDGNVQNTFDRRSLLSAVWIFGTINFVFCDVISLMDGAYLRDILAGPLLPNGMTLDPVTLLFFSMYLELGFLMIVLSKVLKQPANRMVNMVVAVLMAGLQIWSLFGENLPHYIFFSIVEIGAYVCAFVMAASWSEGKP